MDYRFSRNHRSLQVPLPIAGKPAPRFPLPDRDGRMVDLASFAGRWVAGRVQDVLDNI